MSVLQDLPETALGSMEMAPVVDMTWAINNKPYYVLRELKPTITE